MLQHRHITDADRIEILEEEVRQLKARIALLAGMGMEERIRKAFGMTTLQAACLALLISRHQISRKQLLEELYDSRASLFSRRDGEGTYQSAGALFKHVRFRLRRHGIAISTIYGYGWEMSEDMRARAKALLAKVAA